MRIQPRIPAYLFAEPVLWKLDPVLHFNTDALKENNAAITGVQNNFSGTSKRSRMLDEFTFICRNCSVHESSRMKESLSGSLVLETYKPLARKVGNRACQH